MQMHQYNTYIPFEIGDIIKAEEYANEYEIIDILTIYSAKNKTIETILKLKDMFSDLENLYKFNDYKWKMVIVNSDRKEVKDE